MFCPFHFWKRWKGWRRQRQYDKGRIERQRVVAKATRRLKSILMMKQQIFRCLILFVNKLWIFAAYILNIPKEQSLGKVSELFQKCRDLFTHSTLSKLPKSYNFVSNISWRTKLSCQLRRLNTCPERTAKYVFSSVVSNVPWKVSKFIFTINHYFLEEEVFLTPCLTKLSHQLWLSMGP